MENKEIQEKPKKKKVTECEEELRTHKETQEEKEREDGFKANKDNLDYLKEINGNDGYNHKTSFDHYQTKTIGFGKYYDEECFQKYDNGLKEACENKGDKFGLPCAQEIVHKIYLLKGYFLHHIDKFQNGLTAIEYALDDRSIYPISEEIEAIFEANKGKNSDLHNLFIKLFRIKAKHNKLHRESDYGRFNYSWSSLYRTEYGYLRDALDDVKKYKKEELLKDIEENGGNDIPHNFLQKIYVYLVKNHGDKIKSIAREEIFDETEDEEK